MNRPEAPTWLPSESSTRIVRHEKRTGDRERYGRFILNNDPAFDSPPCDELVQHGSPGRATPVVAERLSGRSGRSRLECNEAPAGRAARRPRFGHDGPKYATVFGRGTFRAWARAGRRSLRSIESRRSSIRTIRERQPPPTAASSSSTWAPAGTDVRTYGRTGRTERPDNRFRQPFSRYAVQVPPCICFQKFGPSHHSTRLRLAVSSRTSRLPNSAGIRWYEVSASTRSQDRTTAETCTPPV
jgi:hypothetical protein